MINNDNNNSELYLLEKLRNEIPILKLDSNDIIFQYKKGEKLKITSENSVGILAKINKLQIKDIKCNYVGCKNLSKFYCKDCGFSCEEHKENKKCINHISIKENLRHCYCNFHNKKYTYYCGSHKVNYCEKCNNHLYCKDKTKLFNIKPQIKDIEDTINLIEKFQKKIESCNAKFEILKYMLFIYIENTSNYNLIYNTNYTLQNIKQFQKNIFNDLQKFVENLNNIENKVIQGLSCDICFEQFSQDDKGRNAPRILKCGHTFCTECLKKMSRKVGQNYITCPVDRTKGWESNVVENIPINRIVTNIIDENPDVKLRFNNSSDIIEHIESERNILAQKEFNVVVLGDHKTGKKKLIERLSTNDFMLGSYYSSDINFKVKNLKYRDNLFKITFWYIPPFEDGSENIYNHYNNANFVLFVFDVNNAETFKNVKKYVEDFTNNKDKIINNFGALVGCKIDEHKNQINFNEAFDYAEDLGIKYIEVSSKCGTNFDEFNQYIVSNLYNHWKKGDYCDDFIRRRNPYKGKKRLCYIF